MTIKEENPFERKAFTENDEYQLAEEIWGYDRICPKCKKPFTEFWVHGKRKTTRKGKIPKFSCLNCGYTSRSNDIDFRHWHSKNTILKFLELRKAGYKCFNIPKLMKGKISHMTSYRWDKKFIKNTKI